MSSKPEWISEYGPDYEDIVKSWGYEVQDFETFGSYQGDHLALLRKPSGDLGLIVFGYGSCSGCDTLQAITPWLWDDEDDADYSRVVEFADELRREVHWEPTREALRDWADANPENHWWSYEEDIARWLNANLGTQLRTNA